MLFKKDELRLLGLFYLTSFIRGSLMLIYPILTIYFIEKRFSLVQVSILLAFMPLCSSFFQLPTGAFADKFGRKTAVLLGLILAGFFYFIIPFATTSYPLVLLVMMFASIFQSFMSGADEAWVVNLLKEKQYLIKEYYTKNQSFLYLGAIIAALLNSFIVTFFGMDLIWHIYGLSFVLAACILFFIPQDAIKRNTGNMRTIIKISIQYLLNNKIIVLITLATSLNVLGGMIGGVAWQPFWKFYGIPTSFFGILFGIGYFLNVFFSLAVPSCIKWCKSEAKFLIIVSIIDFLRLFIIYFIHTPFFAGFIVIPSFITAALYKPTEAMLFQKNTTATIRATVRSFYFMVTGTLSALGFVISGIISQTFSPQTALVVSSFPYLVVIGIYLYIKKN